MFNPYVLTMDEMYKFVKYGKLKNVGYKSNTYF